jgi:two-component system NtrC family response regulator/two-component system nitrogen regulation response regulator GlnG
MQDVCKKIGRAAPTDATILIRGESGTGKELVAQAIHKHSSRSKAPFQVINCVAIPDTLLESELFGYEKGAFTGASHRKAGKIELANGGTVFLDEIGDMPTSIQAKILRLLQERQVERLGGSHPISVDVRVLAATNKDLEQAVANGEFREDLYYRLNVVNIPLPPIRERTEDIPMLAEHFLSMHSSASDMHNPGLTDEALAMMRKYSWPGNVRELSNKMHKALIFSRGLPLGKDDFVKLVDGVASTPQTVGDEEDIRSWVTRTLLTEHHEKTFETLADRFGAIVISEALELASWNKTRAAKLLGMSRPTLLGRIEKYGLKENGR